MRDKTKSAGLVESFRNSRQQFLSRVDESKERKAKPLPSGKTQGFDRKREYGADRYFQEFLNKYHDTENYVNEFSPTDLAYFFRETANKCYQEKGLKAKYVISNMRRDAGIFKGLLKHYSPGEICLMIEFVFFSDQNYLDITITQPTVFSSSWKIVIYRDTMLWCEDKYIPEVKSVREWKGDTKESAKVGEW